MSEKAKLQKTKKAASNRYPKVSDIDEYISRFSGDIKERLIQIREIVHNSAPEAIEKISYSMPAFWQKEVLVYFAAMKNHIGFYPGAEGVAAFSKELENYKTSKGAIQFPYKQPLPLDLIKKIVLFRLKKITKKRTIPKTTRVLGMVQKA